MNHNYYITIQLRKKRGRNMLAKAIEKIESLVNAKENCHVEEKMIFGEKYIKEKNFIDIKLRIFNV